MSFLGRMIGGALERSLGGPLGTLLGTVAEHIAQQREHDHADGAADPQRRIAFTIAAIALGAKMARADGEVTRKEIAAFHDVFETPPGEEDHVRLVFDLARKSTLGFDSYARQIGRLFAEDHGVLEHLLDGLFHIALADGALCPAEDAYLREVASHFGFTTADYARIRAHHIAPQDSDADNACRILGIAPGAPFEELRLAYHRLLLETHPDRVVAQGLPPECVALATARTARINAAYESLARGRDHAAAAR
jgi:DnaJ like chaperone protein